jgi:hypothetical protein
MAGEIAKSFLVIFIKMSSHDARMGGRSFKIVTTTKLAHTKMIS